MIKKPQFLNLIRQGEFKDLFISELGWNRYRGQAQLPSIMVDDKEYTFTTIAERSGFQILFSEVDEIPTQSVAKKIDTKLRRQAQDYISIYRLKGSAHDLWVVPVRANEKRDLVLVEYADANAEVLYQKIDGITFSFDERTNIVDLRAKVQTAFAINSEKITKDFYAGFKKQHKAFAELIEGIDDHIEARNNRNKQWYASVILNRLMFCYFIQKKGFLDLDVDYLRNKLNYVRANEGEDRFYNFYRSFLRRLFHDGLNTPKHSHDFEKMFGKIPYLNGGMFDEHQLEADYSDIDIPDEAFISLFDFFDKWNWHLDTRLTASGRDINPDVLGYIFEQYINDRAQMGAYYTKEDITEYIGRNCILPFIFDKVRNATSDSDKAFAPDGFVWSELRKSGDRYIFDAVKKGYKDFGEIPESIARGIITEAMRQEYSETPIGDLPETHVPLSELRLEWNTRTPERWGLPNEIWRETIERIQRCGDILGKISQGEITSINDFITYNLDIRTFAADLLAKGDSRFVGWFYHALQSVTVLDPTCGSGAFLFSAMNILEPLYEICIDRMQEFNQQNPLLFKSELAEITDKYRSNIQYFIFKSIILRNLYGVDIMVEATEIAKLRLFLKMVAVVDVDRRADNLGLDPLPDIDFNIRCGNTLVGYANKEQLDHDLSHAGDILQELANQEFKEQIEEEMQKVARAFDIFKYIQLRQDEDMAAFKQVKNELRDRLLSLNDKLNRRLFIASTGYTPMEGEDFTKTKAYRDWLASHQPFHWLAEFYQIIEGNQGFDVIIGNPPYVVYSSGNIAYKVENYVSSKARNLYAFCIERSLSLINSHSYISMIVPISISNGSNYKAVRNLLFKRGTVHYSHYAGDSHPSCLFNGVQQNLTIFISSPEEHNTFTTNYVKFYTEERFKLYSILKYCKIESPLEGIIRFGSVTQKLIGEKINKKEHLKIWLTSNSSNKMYFKNTSGAAYKPFFSAPPFFEVGGVQVTSKTVDLLAFKSKDQAKSSIALFNSNLFNFLFLLVSDARHITPRESQELLRVDKSLEFDKSLHRLSERLEQDYHTNSSIVTYNKKNGITRYAQFNPRLSKDIMDKIDVVLARHYGFTDEELDFIINYDIKYRMGDELNNGED